MLGYFICATYAPAETADLDASLAAAELTYNHAGADVMGWGHQSSTRYEVVVGSIRVSFLVQPSDNHRDGLGSPEATQSNSYWQHVSSKPDAQIQLTPTCAPEPVDGENIREAFWGLHGPVTPRAGDCAPTGQQRGGFPPTIAETMDPFADRA